MAHTDTRLWRETPDLDDLLADEITIAVMRADNVTPTEIRRLFHRMDRASQFAPPPQQPCRIFRR